MFRNRFFLSIIALTILTGCAGPGAIRTETGLYNRAAIKTLNEQLLINLVRHKYRDIPYFLGIGSITTTKETTVGASASGTYLLPPFRGLLRAEHIDAPTISYFPLQGEDFLKNILAPIPPEALLVLMQSGWSAKRVLGICAERINDLDNATTASGPTPKTEPRFRAFHRMATLLRKFQNSGLMTAGMDQKGKIVIRVDSNREYAAEVAEFKRLLGVKPWEKEFTLTSNFLHRHPGKMAVRSRSISSILFFLSQNIEVPQPHIAQGLVTVTRDSQGGVFDWDEVCGDLLKVWSSKTPPANSYVTIQYRGWYFYIKDNDLNSKSTFMLLTQLFNLQAGQKEIASPQLTIPLGRR